MNPEPSERLFVALPLPLPVREALAALAEPLAGVRWTSREQLHVTLRFLGDVPESRNAAVLERLASVRVAPFILPLETLGSFPPNSAPRILWMGVGTGHPRLFQLRQRMDDALLAAGLPLEVRSFHPHVTLGRVSEHGGPAATQWLHQNRERTAPSFRVEAFDLYASDVLPGGAIHTLKHRFPLAE